MSEKSGAAIDVADLEHNEAGQLKCPRCGRWGRALFRVSTGPAQPVCQPCASSIIRQRKQDPEPPAAA